MATCFTEKVFLRSKPLWVVYVYMDATIETHPFITTTKLKPPSIPEADFSNDRNPILRFKTKGEMSMYPFSMSGYVYMNNL